MKLDKSNYHISSICDQELCVVHIFQEMLPNRRTSIETKHARDGLLRTQEQNGANRLCTEWYLAVLEILRKWRSEYSLWRVFDPAMWTNTRDVYQFGLKPQISHSTF